MGIENVGKVNKEAQKLLVSNPKMYSDKNKYIWIDDLLDGCRNAQHLFEYFLKKKIYINGFATRSPLLIGLKMYNKKVFDADNLDETKSIIFFYGYFRTQLSNAKPEGEMARVVNPDINEKDIVIWGAGITGEMVYRILSENGFVVKGFVDSDIKLQKSSKHGLLVCAPDSLDDYGEDLIVVEALENWKSVDDYIKDKKWRRYYFTLKDLKGGFDIIKSGGGVGTPLFQLSEFWLFHFFDGKKLYIYGNGDVEREFAKYIELMDYNFCGFLADSMVDHENESLQYLEDILYEDNYFIWIYDESRIKRLTELGLQPLIHWICGNYVWDITKNGKIALDINLGVTLLMDSQYPGFTVYGREQKRNYKIAVLGGSTTDGMLYPYKSWPELLWEDIGNKNVIIYNGGVRGYTSRQELIKLVRDVLVLNPNMVIVYDGCNDLNVNIRFPFAFPYAKNVYEFAGKNMESNISMENSQIICEGVETKLSRFDGWLSTMKNMHAVAVEHGIRFFSFCQPVLSCKEGKTDKEKNMLLSMPSEGIDFWIKNYFRNDMSEQKDLPDYIYDFTGIFDNIDDVYIDVCHVNEKGNQIVADKIKEVIYEIVLDDMKQENHF